MLQLSLEAKFYQVFLAYFKNFIVNFHEFHLCSRIDFVNNKSCLSRFKQITLVGFLIKL